MSSIFTIVSRFKSKHNDPNSIVDFYKADLMQISLGKIKNSGLTQKVHTNLSFEILQPKDIQTL